MSSAFCVKMLIFFQLVDTCGRASKLYIFSSGQSISTWAAIASWNLEFGNWSRNSKIFCFFYICLTMQIQIKTRRACDKKGCFLLLFMWHARGSCFSLAHSFATAIKRGRVVLQQMFALKFLKHTYYAFRHQSDVCALPSQMRTKTIFGSHVVHQVSFWASKLELQGKNKISHFRTKLKQSKANLEKCQNSPEKELFHLAKARSFDAQNNWVYMPSWMRSIKVHRFQCRRLDLASAHQ